MNADVPSRIAPRDARIWAVGEYLFHPDSGIALVDDHPHLSLADPDVALLGLLKPPESYRSHNGSPLYESGDYRFAQRSAERGGEVARALDAGKTVFVELLNPLSVRAFRDQQYGGPLVAWGYDFIDGVPAMSPKFGHHMRVAEGVPAALRAALAQIAALSTYEALFDAEGWTPLLRARTDDRCASAVRSISSGHVVLLPALPKFRGEPGGADSVESQRFAAALRAIDRGLREEEADDPGPEWVTELATPRIMSLGVDFDRISTAIAELSDRQRDVDAERIEARRTLDLLFATGPRLEKAVRRSLALMGIKTAPFADPATGADFDVFGDFEGVRLVGEVEGKDRRAIDNEKAQQLSANFGMYVSELADDVNVLPVLFGNPNRLESPELRTESFSTRCRRILPHAALVLTSSMFESTRYLEDHEDDEVYRSACRDALRNAVGRIAEFPEPPQ